jgi:hypothetical protein
MRVGATAALGAKYLARPDAKVVGMLGSGGMARSFAMGFAAVRNLQTIKVYSPNREHLLAYCHEMSSRLQIDVVPEHSPEGAIRGSDIVASCTNSREPVLRGQWLEPGVYLTNVADRELDREAFQRITLVGYFAFNRDPLRLSGFADHNFEIRAEVMAYLSGRLEERESIPRSWYKEVQMPNANWISCLDSQAAPSSERPSQKDISFLAEVAGSNFESGLSSSGIQGLQFACIGGKAYELAASHQLGKHFDLRLFLQDTPT